MRPDNTPVKQSMPIGRVTWFDSFVTAAKITTNVIELAVSVTMPLRQFAYRLMDLSWSMVVTDADALNDMNDWEDFAFLTIPTNLDPAPTVNMGKSNTIGQATITNLFSSQEILPGQGAPFVNTRGMHQDPFIPASPMIFRMVNITSNASAAMTFNSHMWAYVYTIEQYNQGHIWTAMPIGNA